MNYDIGAMTFIVAFSCAIIGGLICSFFKNPFDYPSFSMDFDISNKRKPVYEDYVDDWINSLCNQGSSVTNIYNKLFQEWVEGCEYYLENNCVLWKSRRTRMYEEIRDCVLQPDYKIFEFRFNRNQTRYRQQNYQKYAYVVSNTDNVCRYTLNDLLCIERQLGSIDYETTRSKYTSKNQRKMMTKELREAIKLRDNYTCQICGKYMPDEVGLHIDHIIPIKRGGKSVESNLQVLCDKCNLKKSTS